MTESWIPWIIRVRKLPVDGTHFCPRNSSSPRGDIEYSVIETFNLYSGGILRSCVSTTLRIAWYSSSCYIAVSQSTNSSGSSLTIVLASAGSRDVSIAVCGAFLALSFALTRALRVSIGIAITLAFAASTSGRNSCICRSIKRSSFASLGRSWSYRESASARLLSFLGMCLIWNL